MKDHLAEIRRLTKALFASGALNIILTVILAFWAIREKPPVPYYEHKPAATSTPQKPAAMGRSNVLVVRQFRDLPLEQLAAKLTDTQIVQNGYSKRDLALACMVASHHFDLQKALAACSPPSEKRLLAYGRHKDGSPAEMIVYPGLSDEQFAAIINYANTEKWPFTSKGLFLNLRHKITEGTSIDPSLADAFYLTPEFTSVERLFSRSAPLLEKQELLKIICESNWETLSSFFEQQRASQDLSDARRRWFLLKYAETGSQSAAAMLSNYERKTQKDKLVRLERLPKAPRLYIVQEGDSLWKISRLFKVDMEHLRKANNLESDTLQPGASLNIPQ